jgi:hypothetical protein
MGFLNKILKRRMTQTDMYESIQKKLIDYTWMEKEGVGWVREALLNITCIDGSMLNDKWRDSLENLIVLISKEKTWDLQKAKLIHFCVASNDMLALNAVLFKAHPFETLFWHNYLSGAPNLKRYPKSEWLKILRDEYIINISNSSMLHVIGVINFNLSDDTITKISSYRKIKEHHLEKKFGLLEGIQLLLDDHNGSARVQEKISKKFKNKLLLFDNEYEVLFRSLAADITAEVSVVKYSKMLESLILKNNIELNRFIEDVRNGTY